MDVAARVSAQPNPSDDLRTMNAQSAGAPRVLPRGARHTLLTAHIIVSVGLLGDTAGFLAIAVRLASTHDPAGRVELLNVLNMFATFFGIPLSVGALVSGIVLGLGTKWGVLRYPWVVAKLALIISVMVVGGAVIGPALHVMLSGDANATRQLMAAGAYDLLALAVATGLSVFKPGRPFR
jgi:hypothetical protein